MNTSFVEGTMQNFIVLKMVLQLNTRNIVMRCAIWYHLYNFKNAKNTHGGVLLLVNLQAKSQQLY